MKYLAAPVAFMLAALPVGADSILEIKLDAGEAFFEKECRRCHAVGAEDPSYGPLLENVVGRQAGSLEGYEYSDALASSGIVWTPAALRAWLEDNDGFMPGTKMRHVGIEDRTVQDFILTYLENISDNTAD